MQYGSITSQFSSMSPDSFEQELDKRWEAIESVRDVVQRQVKSGNLSPMDALKTIAASTASILGYEEFHPSNGTPPSLVETLVGGVAQQRQRELSPA